MDEAGRHLPDFGLIPFLDFAYQGFGEGIDADAFAVRAFAEAGIPCLIANSFSKSFALYRERVGALTIVTASEEEAKRVRSQIKRVIRTNYSSPASHGAQLVASVLADSALRARWEGELAEMRERIRQMRELFVRRIREKGVEQDFSFIERQRGMFSYSGLSRETVDRLRKNTASTSSAAGASAWRRSMRRTLIMCARPSPRSRSGHRRSRIEGRQSGTGILSRISELPPFGLEPLFATFCSSPPSEQGQSVFIGCQRMCVPDSIRATSADHGPHFPQDVQHTFVDIIIHDFGSSPT